MIASVHLAAPGTRRSVAAYRSAPHQAAVAGLTYAETVFPAPLGPAVIPRMSVAEVGLIASWEDDEHLDRFLAEPAVAGPFATGWHLRMRPLRVFGAWPKMPGLPAEQIRVDDEEPVAVLTLGRPRLRRLPTFLRTAGRAEADLDGASGLLASIGFGHPPRLVSTFSLWESAAAMRTYAHDNARAHMAAVRSDRTAPFHHESAFIRFRPYRSTGSWNGRDPLAGVLRDDGVPA